MLQSPLQLARQTFRDKERQRERDREVGQFNIPFIGDHVRTLHNQVLGTGTKNTGGKPNGHTEMNQHADGQPHRCLEESATLLHGGLDTSRQVTSKGEKVATSNISALALASLYCH